LFATQQKRRELNSLFMKRGAVLFDLRLRRGLVGAQPEEKYTNNRLQLFDALLCVPLSHPIEQTPAAE
jgi:hypothetical protein